MLQFGLRAHDFGKLPAIELAKALSAFSPASIQLAFAKALSDTPSKSGMFTPGYARRLRDIFASQNIAISVLGCYINPVHPDSQEREKHLTRFEEHLRITRDLGCAIVGTETGSCNGDCSYHSDTANEATFDLLCTSLERLLKTAEKFGAIVGVEAVAGKHTIDSIPKMRRLLDRLDSPNLQVIYDPVNLIPIEGLSISQADFFSQAFSSFGSKIAVIHIKDYKMENGVKKDGLPSGTGELDYPSLFKILQEKKPFIDVLLENSIPDSLDSTLNFVRKVSQETRVL